jgi:hypothetical protein
MICETSPYPAGTDNIVQTASGSALVNLVDAEGTPIGSVKQGVSLHRDSLSRFSPQFSGSHVSTQWHLRPDISSLFHQRTGPVE